MKKSFVFFLAIIHIMNAASQNVVSKENNMAIIDQLLDRQISITIINGDTFLQRDLTDYLNATLGTNHNDIENSQSDAHTNVHIVKDYFMRPHPNVFTLRNYFNQASNEFGVPVSLLMVIGQVENNWTQIGPSIDQGWGIMHLVKNNYSNTLGEAAQLIGVSEQVLKDDALQNIRGAAALIAKYAGKKKKKFKKLEDWFPALAKFSGLISTELMDMQAATYYQTLKNGVQTKTVWGEQIIIKPMEIINLSNSHKKKTNNVPLPTTRTADYGPAIAAFTTCNYTSGRSYAIDTWVNHWIGTGTYAGAISWFQNCSASASAHFVIRNSDGEISQSVAVANTAWHCGAAGFPANNGRSIGVEHEATAANPSMWNSAPMQNASATMACYFKNLYGFPTTQNASPGICGHNDMPGTSTSCPGPLPWTSWFSYFNSACGTSPPPNNTCSGAQLLSSNLTCINTAGTVAGYTASGLPQLSCDAFAGPALKDVWYEFQASSSSHDIIVSSSSNFDAVLGLYSSCTGSEIGCADAGGDGVSETINAASLIIGNTYYIRVYDYGSIDPITATFDICITHLPPPPPTSLSVASSSCPNIDVTLNWANSGTGWYLDVSTDPSFATFYNKDVSGLTSINCPGAFCDYPACTSYLQFRPGTTYYWRIWNGTTQTYGSSFTTPSCMSTDANCAGTFEDTGGSGFAYTGNEDYIYIIEPTGAINVSMNFTGFDLENGYDSLYIYDGNSTTTALIGAYTGTTSPGSFTSSGNAVTLHFVSDPYVNNAGFASTWNCTMLTTGIDDVNSNNPFSVYPNPFTNTTTLSYYLNVNADVEIYLCDVLGKQINLLKSNQSSGKHELAINSNDLNLAKGMYFVKLKMNDEQKTIKLILR